ncbi:MAG TPA: hypothetical protein PK304_04155, partial [Mobilitalea sp.]|nr:hypothetical protein [Mobilitalea sp.]
MKGSQITSTIQPPKKNPIGMVKNCKVLRHEYTLPCISAGIVDLTITSKLVFINGTGKYPSICAIHHVTGLLVSDIRKLSVVRENSIVAT